MIKRIWHGYTTPERADEYEALLKAEVIAGIEAKGIPGFRGIDVLRRSFGDEVEFITIMEFDDLDSVRAFVGEDYEQAYVPDEARTILSRFDERSQHFEVRDSRDYGETAEIIAPPVVARLTDEPAAPEVITAKPAFALPPDIWFVRKNDGRGAMPVTQQGYKVGANFILTLLALGVLAVAIAVGGRLGGPGWLTQTALPVFLGGAVLAAIFFMLTTRKHTDRSLTYAEYVKARKNA